MIFVYFNVKRSLLNIIYKLKTVIIMKRFIIFRHGETDYNKSKRMQGCGIDMDLNAAGRAQAVKLTDILRKYEVKAVYSSPLQRALSTANIAAQPLSVPIRIYADLKEACLGNAEGRPFSEIEALYPEIWKHWYTPNLYMDLRFPGGESKQEIGDRIAGTLRAIAVESENIPVVGISTHGAAIRNFLMPLGREDKPMKNGEVYIVDYDGVDFRLIGQYNNY